MATPSAPVIRETQPGTAAPFPALNLSHLKAMTDSTGMLQHARFSVPHYDEGYCIDDNARALLLMTFLEQGPHGYDPELGLLASRYLAFVNHAFNPELGRFRNFMGYSRLWQEVQGSEDSHGRALWALGATAGQSCDPGRRALAGRLFQAGLPAVRTFAHPRSWAYALLGVQHYLASFPSDPQVAPLESLLAGRLQDCHRRASGPGWQWFEDRVTYSNARLPQALLRSGIRHHRQDWTGIGLDCLEWLARVQSDPQGRFAPVGSNGFFTRGGSMARFDQQPVDACATVSACLDAGAASGESKWRERALEAFSWFLGRNQVGLPLYDSHTGGCRDGLHAGSVNQNQGAESTLSFLLALVEMDKSRV